MKVVSPQQKLKYKHLLHTCTNALKSDSALISPRLSTLAVRKKHSQMNVNFVLSDAADAMDLSGED